MVTIQLEPAKERQLRELASAKGQEASELARLRRVLLDAIMEELGLQDPGYV